MYCGGPPARQALQDLLHISTRDTAQNWASGPYARLTQKIGPSKSLGLKVAFEELGDFVLLREELANLWVARVRQSRGNGS